ncbi:hypothetical protein [Cereibacter sphaeroides]|nr:hypothetical protein [Cereibacter sphaeroides]MCE6972786.1 hypothetical protein [Cereibacter sphaeroides]
MVRNDLAARVLAELEQGPDGLVGRLGALAERLTAEPPPEIPDQRRYASAQQIVRKDPEDLVSEDLVILCRIATVQGPALLGRLAGTLPDDVPDSVLSQRLLSTGAILQGSPIERAVTAHAEHLYRHHGAPSGIAERLANLAQAHLKTAVRICGIRPLSQEEVCYLERLTEATSSGARTPALHLEAIRRVDTAISANPCAEALRRRFVRSNTTAADIVREVTEDGSKWNPCWLKLGKCFPSPLFSRILDREEDLDDRMIGALRKNPWLLTPIVELGITEGRTAVLLSEIVLDLGNRHRLHERELCRQLFAEAPQHPDAAVLFEAWEAAAAEQDPAAAIDAFRARLQDPEPRSLVGVEEMDLEDVEAAAFEAPAP